MELKLKMNTRSIRRHLISVCSNWITELITAKNGHHRSINFPNEFDDHGCIEYALYFPILFSQSLTNTAVKCNGVWHENDAKFTYSEMYVWLENNWKRTQELIEYQQGSKDAHTLSIHSHLSTLETWKKGRVKCTLNIRIKRKGTRGSKHTHTWKQTKTCETNNSRRMSNGKACLKTKIVFMFCVRSEQLR